MNKGDRDKQIYEMFEQALRAAKFIFGGGAVSMTIAILIPDPAGQYLGALVFFSIGLYWFLTRDRIFK